MSNPHPHDRAYRNLFSNPRILSDFLASFLPADLMQRLDPMHAEPLNATFVTPELKKFESDLIFKVPLQQSTGNAYIFILIELQSTNDPTMAVRVANYVILFYLDWLKRNSDANKLPPVFPFVYYNGKDRWSAPSDLGEMIEDVPEIPAEYRPHFRYLPVLLRDMEMEQLQHLKGTMGMVARTELGVVTVEALVREVFAIHQEDKVAGSLMGNWLVLKMRKSITAQEQEALLQAQYQEPKELESMLTNLLEQTQMKWWTDGIEVGIQKGVEKGRVEGIEKGRIEGIQKGVEKGRIEGMEESFLRFVNLNLGVQPYDVQERLRYLVGLRGFDEMATRLRRAQSVTDLFAGE